MKTKNPKQKVKREDYTCAHCGNTYEKGWSDEEAYAEATELFGKPPAEWNDEQVVICDDCFNKMHPKDNPEAVESAKKFI